MSQKVMINFQIAKKMCRKLSWTITSSEYLAMMRYWFWSIYVLQDKHYHRFKFSSKMKIICTAYVECVKSFKHIGLIEILLEPICRTCKCKKNYNFFNSRIVFSTHIMQFKNQLLLSDFKPPSVHTAILPDWTLKMGSL